MDVKFTKTRLTFIPWENILWGLAPYLIPNIYIFQKPITIIDLENKMWGHGISTLKSPKFFVTKYNSLHFKNLTRCIHQTWWKYCELWGYLKSLEWDLLNSFIKIHIRWRFCMWWTYFDQNNTRHKVWKMKNIFQKWGYLSDIFVWNFRWKMKMI
jgi:hypothetical protein